MHHNKIGLSLNSLMAPLLPELIGFCSMKQLGLLLLLLDGMLVHHRYPPPPSISADFPDSLLVPIYTPGWREAL